MTGWTVAHPFNIAVQSYTVLASAVFHKRRQIFHRKHKSFCALRIMVYFCYMARDERPEIVYSTQFRLIGSARLKGWCVHKDDL